MNIVTVVRAWYSIYQATNQIRLKIRGRAKMDDVSTTHTVLNQCNDLLAIYDGICNTFHHQVSCILVTNDDLRESTLLATKERARTTCFMGRVSGCL